MGRTRVAGAQQTRVDRASQLMASAVDQTGCSDFGEDSFREGLDRIIAAVDTEGHLNDIGRMILDSQMVGMLANRLQVEDWYRRHPEIDEQEIVAPLFGLGLPRTGSTALAAMLAEDENYRVLRVWEASQPCPPPEAATQHTDPRIAIAEAQSKQADAMFPRLKELLPNSVTGPIECQGIMGFDFKTQLFQAYAHIPSYIHWLNYEADMVPTFRYLKRVMKLLQWHCPPSRWRLKNPSHILFIDALNEVFPDARFWMTHRDVASVIPSVCDLYCQFCEVYSDELDRTYLARMNTDWTELGMRRMIAFRDEKGNNGRFFDTHFATFQKDPLPEIARLYAFLGEEFTDAARQRMLAWRASSGREQPVARSYDLASFGIDLDKVRARFRFYTDRFHVN